MLRHTLLGPGLAVLLIMLLPAGALAQGGPPLITDDPDTPGPGYWEINLASVLETSRLDRQLEAPLADINYGVGERIQLKAEGPWLSAREKGEPLQTGLGNAIFGVKWRFLGQESERIAWSTYPQVEVNAGRSMAESGFLTEGWQFFLPTEFTVRKGRLEITGEVGWNFVEKGDNEWLYGLSTELELYPRLELVGELHGEQSGPSPAELIVNMGGHLKITNRYTLLLAVGRDVHGLPEERTHFRLYTGLQLNLPHQYSVSQATLP